MHNSALIRPDWTPAKIALMVLAFIVFWPLGLAMLAYILFGGRMRAFKRDHWEKWRGEAPSFSSCRAHRGHHPFSTGNMAFDDWRRAEMDRIEEERRKLDEMRREFDAYMRELKRARDQEEFDRFMRDRKASGATDVTPDTTSS